MPEVTLEEECYPSTEVVAQAEFIILPVSLSVSLVEPAGIAFGEEAPSLASYAILVNGWQGGDEDLLLSILKDAVSVSCEYEESDDAGSCPVTVE